MLFETAFDTSSNFAMPCQPQNWEPVRHFLNDSLSKQGWGEALESLTEGISEARLFTALHVADALLNAEQLRTSIEILHDSSTTETLLKFYWRAPVVSIKTREKMVACASFLYSLRSRAGISTSNFAEYLAETLEIDPYKESSSGLAETASSVERISGKARECKSIPQLANELRESSYQENRQKLMKSNLTSASLAAIAKSDREIGNQFDLLFSTLRDQTRLYIDELQQRLAETEEKSFLTICPSVLDGIWSFEGKDSAQLFTALDETVKNFGTVVCHISEPEIGEEDSSAFDLAPKDPDKQQEVELQDVRTFIVDRVRRSQEDIESLIIDSASAHTTLIRTDLDAFRAKYLGEKSFRGNYTELIVNNAVLRARMTKAVIDFEKFKDSTFLWQSYVHALKFLHPLGLTAVMRSAELSNLCARRGLLERQDALDISSQEISQLLQRITDQLPPTEENDAEVAMIESSESATAVH